MTKKESDYEFRIEADMRLLVPAYALYIKHLREQLAETRKRAADESNARDMEDIEREKVIWEFVLRHMGRDMLMLLGRAIDEEKRKRTGKHDGCEEFLDMEY